ncbi:uncharacterized protein LOC115215234 [Argonauta hians]
MAGKYFLVKLSQLAILLTLVSLTKSEHCEKLSPCSCKKENGDIIDLHRFEQTSFKYPAGGYLYVWTPCQSFICNDGVQQTICKSNLVLGSTVNLGSLNSTKFSISEENIVLTYEDPSKTSTSSIKLLCDKRISQNFSLIKNIDVIGHSSYAFELRSNSFCFDHSLSTGTIICIVFLCVVILYLVLGTVINKFVRHATGLEVIPNVSMWKSCAGYIHDGFLFSAGRCGNLNKRKNYSEI